jgi:hypothetical protein
MACSRNKSNIGDYALYKQNMMNQHQISMDRSFYVPPHTYHPGFGLLSARIPRDQLSHNAIDIETALFGIGSGNFEFPQDPVYPNLKSLPSISIADHRVPFLLPAPIHVSTNNRPMYLQ